MVFTAQDRTITNVSIMYLDILRAINLGTTLVLSLSSNSVAPSWIPKKFTAVLELSTEDIETINSLNYEHSEHLNVDLVVILKQTLIASVYIIKVTEV